MVGKWWHFLWGSKHAARIAKKYPRLGRIARITRFKLWTFLVRMTASGSININKTIWVNPNDIEYVALELYHLFNMGKVIGGNWDKSVEKFEELDVYQSFKKRYINGEDWNTTDFYKRILSEIENGKIKYNCQNKKDLDKRLSKIDDLYNIIKTNGYKTAEELQKENGFSNDPLQKEDEVTVNIGRHGDIFFNNGRHRLSIVKILKIPKIPVKVVARHPGWVNFRKELLEYAKPKGGKLYQPITHPDLQDIPSHHDSFRFEMIKKNISIEKGTVLDIGAEFGYFCHRFEEEGFECYAVEHIPTTIYFLEKLKRAGKRSFKIIPKTIFEYNRDGELFFDIVLALNVFHHFLKTREEYEELISLLGRIKAKEIYFQAHDYDEPQMKGAYKNLHPDEFAELISKYTDLEIKLVEKAPDNRKIYKLAKQT